MDIFSLNTSLLLNIMKTWNNNKEKNMIIDPIEGWETPAMPDVVNAQETSE